MSRPQKANRALGNAIARPVIYLAQVQIKFWWEGIGYQPIKGSLVLAE